jgi:hypothetical protein
MAVQVVSPVTQPGIKGNPEYRYCAATPWGVLFPGGITKTPLRISVDSTPSYLYCGT